MLFATLLLGACASSGHASAHSHGSGTTGTSRPQQSTTTGTPATTAPTTTTMVVTIAPVTTTTTTHVVSGPPGPPGVSEYEIRQNSTTVPTADQSGSVDLSVACPPGKSVISGGASVDIAPADGGLYANGYVQRSEPADASTWTATAAWTHSNTGPAQNLTLTVKAICAVVG